MFGVPLAIVLRLGSASFAEREAATADLRVMGDAAVPLLRAASVHEDPEIRRRAVGLLYDWRGSFRPTTQREMPWLDMLPAGHEDRQRRIDECVGKARGMVLSPGGMDWPEYRLATEHFIDVMIEQGKSRREVIELLDKMAANEQEYHRKHHPPFQPAM